MAAGDIKKPHVFIDRGKGSPGTMRTREVGPGEILIDGDGNPIGGTVVLPTDGEDTALAAIAALAVSLRDEIAQAAQDALAGAIAIFETYDDPPGPVDVQEDTALAAIEALTVELHARVAEASQDAFAGAVALTDACKADVIKTAGADSRSLVDATTASLRGELRQAIQDAFDGAVGLIDALEDKVDLAEGEDYAPMAALENVRSELLQAVTDAFAGAVGLIDALEDRVDLAEGEDYAPMAALESVKAALEQADTDVLAGAIALLEHEAEETLLAANAEARSLVDVAAAGAQSDLEEAVDDVFGGAVALVDRATLDLTVVAQEKADEAVDSAAAGLQSDLSQLSADAVAAIVATEDRLNDRIGKKYITTTLDATPTVIATLLPGALRAMRIFAKVIGHRLDRREAAIYNIVALARATPASDVLQVGAPLPLDGETVTIGAIVYTWRALPVVAYDVNIGATVDISVDNLVKAINLTGTPGLEYGPGTAIHPTVSAVKTLTGGPVVEMDAVAKFTGAAGNGIPTLETMANGVWANLGLGLLFGNDMALFGTVVTTEYEDDAAWNAAIAVSGSDVEIRVTGGLAPIRWQAEVEVLEHGY